MSMKLLNDIEELKQKVQQLEREVEESKSENMLMDARLHEIESKWKLNPMREKK